MGNTTDRNTEILRNYAAELLVDIAFDTSAPNLGQHAAAQLDAYLSNPDNLQLLAMSVFRSSQHLDRGASKMLSSALSQFTGENSYVGTAARRIDAFMKSAGRSETSELPVQRPIGSAALIF